MESWREKESRPEVGCTRLSHKPASPQECSLEAGPWGSLWTGILCQGTVFWVTVLCCSLESMLPWGIPLSTKAKRRVAGLVIFLHPAKSLRRSQSRPEVHS